MLGIVATELERSHGRRMGARDDSYPICLYSPSVMAHFHVFIIFLNFFPSDTEISIVIFTFFMKF